MNATRRGFFAALLGALALPKAKGLMAPVNEAAAGGVSTVLTHDQITLEMLEVLRRNLPNMQRIRKSEIRRFAASRARIGDTIHVKRPARFVVSDAVQRDLDEFSERYTEPYLARQANLWDRKLIEEASLWQQ